MMPRFIKSHIDRNELAGFAPLFSVLGTAAYAGGAPIVRGALQVSFWGALAMGLTAGIGKLFGTVIQMMLLSKAFPMMFLPSL
jgi:hypothetical protein